jgi:hypothetical protein
LAEAPIEIGCIARRLFEACWCHAELGDSKIAKVMKPEVFPALAKGSRVEIRIGQRPLVARLLGEILNSDDGYVPVSQMTMHNDTDA